MRTAALFLSLLLAESPPEPRREPRGQHLKPLGILSVSEGFVFEALWRNNRPVIAMVSHPSENAESSVGIVENHDQAYEHDEYFVVVSRAKAPIWMQYWKALQVIRTKKHILDGTRSTLEDDLAALTSVKPALIESRTPLKKETACDLLLIWASALGAIRPDTSGVIVRDGTRFVFTIYGGGGTTTSPEAASPMGAFVALGDALTRYGEASEAERVESERQLLLQVQASAKSLAADISPTASARTWNPPMACRGRRRE